MITRENTLAELYATPVGHDLLAKILLQMNKPESLLKKGLIAKMKIKTLEKIAGKRISKGLVDTILKMVNTEKDIPITSAEPVKPAWWKEAVFYQIYPRTFCDSNGDCIGDLQGIISKLDYIKDLGIDAIWLSPIYDSPNDDNGYDIRDYYKIMTEFGSMEDFDELLSEVHKRDLRLIMDLVMNHTSDEHEWFQKAVNEPNSKYHDYYIFRKEPNNWTSFFSGPAWNYYEQNEEYALHLFSKKQMDLNWENPEVRADIIKMINWWLDKGIDGFRLDAVNYISKEEGLPEGSQAIGDMIGIRGIEHYMYGPHLHEYFHEIHEKAFKPHNAFSVAECAGLGMEMAKLITGEEREEVDMMFSFDHLEAPGHNRMEDVPYDLDYYRDFLVNWSTNYGNNHWPSLFYNNHDNPKMISKISSNPNDAVALAKLLAVIQMTSKGTPFVYQGEEMGLENYPFTSMEQITDVESKGFYAEHVEEWGHEKTFRIILAGTREHGRVLLPWNDKLPSYHEGLYQPAKPEITEVYKELIALRHREKALVYGEFTLLEGQPGHFTYQRELDGRKFIVDCNLSKQSRKSYQKGDFTVNANLIYATRELMDAKEDLQAYEARIWKI